MSAKKATKGRRYTAAEKKKIVDFVNEHNEKHGRGGQSVASKKFNVSQLTIAKWLQGPGGGPSKSSTSQPSRSQSTAGKSAPKAKKAGKETPKAKKAGASKGQRYSAEAKREILDFVDEYDKQHGRGGQAAAAEKFNVTPLTISNWRKSRGKKSGKMGRPKKAKLASAIATSKETVKNSSPMSSKLEKLQSLHDDIIATESQLARLQTEFDQLKDSL